MTSEPIFVVPLFTNTTLDYFAIEDKRKGVKTFLFKARFTV